MAAAGLDRRRLPGRRTPRRRRPSRSTTESVRALWDFVAERAVDRVTAGGFVSSFTGQPFTEAEVDEYRDRVLALAEPWLRPGRPGCWRSAAARACSSGRWRRGWPAASASTRRRVTQERNREHARRSGLGNVELPTGFAHEIESLGRTARSTSCSWPARSQFFPGPLYLERVIRRGAAAARAGRRAADRRRPDARRQRRAASR